MRPTRSFTIGVWDRMRGALDPQFYDQDWERAISGIEGRFTERFIKPADAIQQLDRGDSLQFPEGRGFAIVALDCLLLESLYGYEKGQRTKVSETNTAFKEMLTAKPQFANAFSPATVAESFVKAVRNGLLHDGETREGWIIWQRDVGGSLVEIRSNNMKILYRDGFHAAVKEAVAEYFRKLRSTSASESVALRGAFVRRVDTLCNESKPKTDGVKQ